MKNEPESVGGLSSTSRLPGSEELVSTCMVFPSWMEMELSPNLVVESISIDFGDDYIILYPLFSIVIHDYPWLAYL